MENNRHSKALAFRKTVVARALMVAFGVVALTGGVSTSAFAQSNATGTVFGQVAPGTGTSVSIENVGTNARRTAVPDSAGRFQITALPPGQYKAQLLKDTTVVSTVDVEVQLGQGSEISFSASKSSLQTVQIVGRRESIDVSNTNQGASFTAQQLESIPVAKNVQSVIQLAPGTTKGDSRLGGGNAPSFGGAASSENSYYVNGYSVTNAFTQIGFAQLPFFSIANTQILSGGYGAEFGRSIGGVVNITTKSGTNEWMAGVSYSMTPNSLRSQPRNIYYPVNGVPDTDGKLNAYRQDNKYDENTTSVFLSGPLIKDKLFLFANLEHTNADSSVIRGSNPLTSGTPPSAAWQEIGAKTDRSLVKLDWNLTDDHHLEYTYMGDKTTDNRKYFGFDYGTLTRNNVQNGGAGYVNYGPTEAGNDNGAALNIFKYTGNLTDNLTVTALVGRSNVPHSSTPVGYDPTIPTVVISTPSAIPPGITIPVLQSTGGPLLVPGATDETQGYRLDLEYKLSQHTIRFGLDNNKLTSTAGTVQYAGPTYWRYYKGSPTVKVGPQGGTPASGGGLGLDGYYVRDQYVASGGTYQAEQSAQYIEDRYQVTKDILLSLGLRNEEYSNYNKDGQVFLQMKNQIDPRIGATWDVNGDASLKLFGNLGRYHLQLPTVVALRMAGGSIYTQQWYVYSGVDAKGNPTGLTPLSGLTSPDGEFGNSLDPKTISSDNLKSNYQDELTLGFEKAVNRDLNVGGRVLYRKLQSTIDDTGDCRPIAAYAAANGITNTTIDPSGYCSHLFNPGVANTFNVDFGSGVLTKVPLSAADLGMPPAQRDYFAIDLFAEKPYHNGWYGKINYTYSRSRGDTEGQLLSDIGQTDVAITQAWDFPEIMLNSNGLLPNNRTHQIKAYGYYDVTPEFGIGANLLMASGRPKNCIGNLPDALQTNPDGSPVYAAAYGSAFFFCNGVPTPRGSQGNLPWENQLDLNFSYKPQQLKGLRFDVTVFNVFNKQPEQNVDELYNDSPTTVSPTYGMPLSFMAPRSVKLTASYVAKF